MARPNPRSTGAVDVAAAIVSVTLAAMVVVARMFTRAFIVKQIGSEDWVILLSLVSNNLLVVCNVHVLTCFSAFQSF